jgi:hypothetical protein|tara:strand:+ start:2181 stop:2330 length:150 start_codon:yes stop_codon:yes gene_type:complete
MREALLDELKDLVGRLVRTTEALSGASLLVSELKSCVAEIVEEEELDEG